MRSRLTGIACRPRDHRSSAASSRGCGDDDDDGGRHRHQTDGRRRPSLIQEGQLLVGTDTPFPPFEIGQPPDIIGYDIEVVNAVAEKLGLQVTYQDTSFDTIFRDTAQGKFDMAVAASTITPEREQTVDFSDPYYRGNQSLLVTTDTDIATVDDLGGATVGAQDGTTGEDYANDETDAAQVRGFPEGPDAINALRNGQVDAVIIDQPVAVDAVEAARRRRHQGSPRRSSPASSTASHSPPDNDALREAGQRRSDRRSRTTARSTKLYEQYFPGTEPPDSGAGGHERGRLERSSVPD